MSDKPYALPTLLLGKQPLVRIEHDVGYGPKPVLMWQLSTNKNVCKDMTVDMLLLQDKLHTHQVKNV